jgi:hypothetical protein
VRRLSQLVCDSCRTWSTENNNDAPSGDPGIAK